MAAHERGQSAEHGPSQRLAAVGAAFELLRHEINNPIQALLAATMAGDAVSMEDFRSEIERLTSLQRLLTHVSQSLEAPEATVHLSTVLDRLSREHQVAVSASPERASELRLAAPSAAVVELIVASRGRRCQVAVALQQDERRLQWVLNNVTVPPLRRPIWLSLAHRAGLGLHFDADHVVLSQPLAESKRPLPAPAGQVAEPLRTELLDVLADGDVAGVRDLLRAARRQGDTDGVLLDHMEALLESFALAELTALLGGPP